MTLRKFAFVHDVHPPYYRPSMAVQMVEVDDDLEAHRASGSLGTTVVGIVDAHDERTATELFHKRHFKKAFGREVRYTIVAD